MRVLLVEDDPAWQQGIQGVLLLWEPFEIVDTVDHFEEALTSFQMYKPDVVLLDWQIRGEKDGLAVGHALMSLGFPKERIILVSGSNPAEIPTHPFGFLSKAHVASDLVKMLQDVTKNKPHSVCHR